MASSKIVQNTKPNIKIGDKVRICNASIPGSLSAPYYDHIGVVHKIKPVTLDSDPPLELMLYGVFFNGADPGFGFFASEIELFSTPIQRFGVVQ